MRRIIAMSLASLLGACMTASTTIRPTSLDPTTQQRWATEVYTTSHCLLARNDRNVQADSVGGALVSALVPGVVDAAFSFFTSALEEAAKDRVTTYVGRRVVPLYRLIDEPNSAVDPANHVLRPTDNVNCVLVVVGNFGPRTEPGRDLYDFHPYFDHPTSPSATDRDARWSGPAFDPATATFADAAARLRAAHIPIVGTPDMVYEAEIVRVPGENAFVLRSNYLHVARYQRRGGHPALSITLAFDNPATNTAGSTLRAAAMQFGAVPVGRTFTRTQFGQGAVSDLMFAMAPSDGAKERQTAVAAIRTAHDQAVADLATQESVLADPAATAAQRRAAERRKAVLEVAIPRYVAQENQLADNSGFLMPMTLTSTVVETQSAPAAARFFNSVWTSARAGLRTVAIGQLDPAQRQTAETAERTARQQLEDQASTTRVAYLEARRTYDQTAATDVVAKEIAHERYIMALRAYNRVLAQMGLPAVTE